MGEGSLEEKKEVWKGRRKTEREVGRLKGKKEVRKRRKKSGKEE